jgi:hypothetical protein
MGVGFFVGGLVGGIGGALFGRAIERKPLKVSVTWIGDKIPIIDLENVLDKVQYVLIIALDKTEAAQTYSSW